MTADRPAPPLAELVLPTATLAIGHSQTVPLFGAGSAHAADNHTVIIEFRVDDVDAEYARLSSIDHRRMGPGADDDALGQPLDSVP